MGKWEGRNRMLPKNSKKARLFFNFSAPFSEVFIFAESKKESDANSIYHHHAYFLASPVNIVVWSFEVDQIREKLYLIE